MKHITAFLLVLSGSAWAQDVVALKAGLVHYVEGDVSLDGVKLHPMKPEQIFTRAPQMNPDSLLRTSAGRAEVLLSPGMILRVGPGSTIKMLSNQLTETRVELVSGTLVLEVMERVKGNAATLHFRDTAIVPRREGVYRLGGAMPELMVYDGRADVVSGNTRLSLVRGRSVALEALAMPRKFDPKKGDEVVAWSVERGTRLALASRSLAGALVDRRRSFRSGGWMWNPAFGLYTFLPFGGQCCGYFGYCFYTPQAYYNAFLAPRPQYSDPGAGSNSGYGSAGGYSTVSQRTYDPGPAISSAPAPSAAPSRGGEGAVSRGGEGGGRSQ
jgi:hypothetical protein